jgi:hypothetical protein
MIYHTKNGVDVNPGFLDEKFFRKAAAIFINKPVALFYLLAALCSATSNIVGNRYR